MGWKFRMCFGSGARRPPHAAGLHELTLESLVRYIEISGQEGEQYLAALELYDVAELAKVEAD